MKPLPIYIPPRRSNWRAWLFDITAALLLIVAFIAAMIALGEIADIMRVHGWLA